MKNTNCSDCGRARTETDQLDYSPLQVIYGTPVGWYSGDDAELCSECMTAALNGGTR